VWGLQNVQRRQNLQKTKKTDMKPTLSSIESKAVLVLKSFVAYLTTLTPSLAITVEW
jgi:hypothetical protein